MFSVIISYTKTGWVVSYFDAASGHIGLRLKSPRFPTSAQAKTWLLQQGVSRAHIHTKEKTND